MVDSARPLLSAFRRYVSFWLGLAAAMGLLALFYQVYGPQVIRVRRAEMAFRAGLGHLTSWGHLPETRDKLADAEFATALRLTRNPDQMLRRITQALAAERLYAEALRYAEIRLKTDASYEQTMLCGHLAYLAGDIEKCAEHFESAIRLKPDDWVAYNELGYCYADLGIELDRAEELLTKALELEEKHRPLAILQALTRALGAEPLAARAMLVDSVAWLHYRQRRYQEAWKEIQEAHSRLPHEATIGYHYEVIKQTIEALEEAERPPAPQPPMTPLAIQGIQA